MTGSNDRCDRTVLAMSGDQANEVVSAYLGGFKPWEKHGEDCILPAILGTFYLGYCSGPLRVPGEDVEVSLDRCMDFIPSLLAGWEMKLEGECAEILDACRAGFLNLPEESRLLTYKACRSLVGLESNQGGILNTAKGRWAAAGDLMNLAAHFEHKATRGLSIGGSGTILVDGQDDSVTERVLAIKAVREAAEHAAVDFLFAASIYYEALRAMDLELLGPQIEGMIDGCMAPVQDRLRAEWLTHDPQKSGGSDSRAPESSVRVEWAKALLWAFWVDGRPSSVAVRGMATVLSKRFDDLDEGAARELILEVAGAVKGVVEGGCESEMESSFLARLREDDHASAAGFCEDIAACEAMVETETEINIGWIRTVRFNLEAPSTRKLVGPIRRPVDVESGAPLFSPEEMSSLGSGAQELARSIPVASKDEVSSLLQEMEGVSCPASLDFLLKSRLEVLEEMYMTTGEAVTAPLGVVPRAWVLRLRGTEMEMGFGGERLDFVLEPTVIVASREHLYWQESGEWCSQPFASGERESMHQWSELFGRGPFAEFNECDLGLEPGEGDSLYFDLFKLEEQNVCQTPYSSEGAPRDYTASSISTSMHSAYDAEGLWDTGGLQHFKRLRSEEGPIATLQGRPDARGFLYDFAALHDFLSPFMVQGGFTAFLPRGLDPHGEELFRYPPISMSASALGIEEPVEDPAGIPLKTLMATRGMTLPLFLEPTGPTGGSHMKVMLASMRNWWPHSGAQIVTGKTGEDVSGWRSFLSLADYSSGRTSLSGSESPRVGDRAAKRGEWTREVSATLGDEEDSGKRAELLESMLEGSAGNAVGYLQLARCLRDVDGRGEEAVAAADRASALYPCPTYFWIAAMARHDIGDAEGRDEQISFALQQWHDMPELVRVWQRSTWFRADRFGDEYQTVENYRSALRLLVGEYPFEDKEARYREIWESAQVGTSTDSLIARLQTLYFDFPDELRCWIAMIVFTAEMGVDEDMRPAVVEAAKARFGDDVIQGHLDRLNGDEQGDSSEESADSPAVSTSVDTEVRGDAGPAEVSPKEASDESASGSWESEPSLTEFVPFAGFSERGDPAALDPSSPDTDAILEAVLEVLAHEAPVELGRLYRLVGKKFGYERVHAERRALIAAAIPEGCLSSGGFGDFVWSTPDQREAYCGARTTPPGMRRPVEEIAPEELGNLLLILAAETPGLGGDALISAAVRALGVKKRGKKILERLTSVYALYFPEEEGDRPSAEGEVSRAEGVTETVDPQSNVDSIADPRVEQRRDEAPTGKAGISLSKKSESSSSGNGVDCRAAIGEGDLPYKVAFLFAFFATIELEILGEDEKKDYLLKVSSVMAGYFIANGADPSEATRSALKAVVSGMGDFESKESAIRPQLLIGCLGSLKESLEQESLEALYDDVQLISSGGRVADLLMMVGIAWELDIDMVSLMEGVGGGADTTQSEKADFSVFYLGDAEAVRAEIAKLPPETGVETTERMMAMMPPTTPLMWASVINQDVEVIRVICDAGADVEAKDENGRTALMNAASQNPNPEICRALLEFGAEVDAVNTFGFTALIVAAIQNPNVGTLSALLDAGADIEATSKDADGATPLLFAAENNSNPEVIRLLLDAGADAKRLTREGKSVMELVQGNDDLCETDVVSLLKAASSK